ncbi:MAG: DUF4013 domain-containing protein, partial [Chloroflexota bacterium]
LVFGIITAMQLILNGNNEYGPGTFFGVIGGLAFGLFMSGYGVTIIRAINKGEDALPAFQIGKNISDGFRIFLAGLIYMLTIIILVVIVAMMMTASMSDAFMNDMLYTLETGREPAYSSDYEQAMGGAVLMLCGTMIVMVPLAIILSFAAQIGIVRYAIEEESRVLFQFGTNTQLVFSNFGKVFKLLILMIVLGLAYGLMGGILGGLVGVVLGAGVSSGIGLIIFAVVLNIVSQLLGTMQQVTNFHLLAGFAQETGLAPTRKQKEVYAFD